MDFIIQLLARLFAGFKLKNPVAAAAVLLLLSAITYTASQGTILGLYTLPAWASPVLTYIGLFLTSVTGSQTYQYLDGAKKTAK